MVFFRPGKDREVKMITVVPGTTRDAKRSKVFFWISNYELYPRKLDFDYNMIVATLWFFCTESQKESRWSIYYEFKLWSNFN